MLATTMVARVIDLRIDDEKLAAAVERTDWFARRDGQRWCLVRRCTGEMFSMEYTRAVAFERPFWDVIYVTL
jgi:hypothetical protein